jgi:serine/threonine-protein kinase
VFSLGTVLYFCATGRLPFVGRNPHHLLKLLLGGEYPDPLRLRPAIGADLTSIMDKALSRNPADRYPSAAEMSAILRDFLAEMGIDDPDETLARYLRAPEQVADELREASLSRLLAIGQFASKSGDVPKAQAALSRALAIDDGNETALKLLGSLGRRQRRGAMIAAALLGSFVIIAAAAAYTSWPRAENLAAEDTLAPPEPDGARLLPPETPATDAPPPEVGATDEPSEVTTSPPDGPNEPVANGRRWVVFKPTPPNVSISVDGGPAKPYGPGFQKIRLKAGIHTFRFVGAEDCCAERVVRKRIPSGARDYELAVKLAYKPARLYLKGPAPPNASVRITLPGNRRVTGRIREILRIPMRSLRTSAQVEVRAPGYQTHKSVVKLRAGGDMTEHSFSLERERETP